MAFVLDVEPTKEPVTLDEAKAHLGIINSTDDDAYISALIETARQYAENFTNRLFVTQDWSLYLDDFSDEMELRSPVQSIIGIDYYDSNNALQSLASSVYLLDSNSTPARVVRATGQSWPYTYTRPDAVRIKFRAGYGDPPSVPQAIKHAILIMVGHFYESREPVVIGTVVSSVPWSAEALLSQYRVY